MTNSTLAVQAQQWIKTIYETYGESKKAVPWEIVRELLEPIKGLVKSPQLGERVKDASKEREPKQKDKGRKTVQAPPAKLQSKPAEGKKTSYAQAAKKGQAASHQTTAPPRLSYEKRGRTKPLQVDITSKEGAEKSQTWTAVELVRKIQEKIPATRGLIDAIKILPYGKLLIHPRNADARAKLQENLGWLGALDVPAEIHSPTFTIVVKRLDNKWNQEEVAQRLTEQNQRFIPGLRFVRAQWIGKSREQGKATIRLDVKAPEIANQAITRGLILDYEFYEVERFNKKKAVRYCFRCHSSRHISKHCRKSVRCGFCAEGHDTRECTKANPMKCVRCGQGHPVWAKECQTRRSERLMKKALPPQFHVRQQTSVINFTAQQETRTEMDVDQEEWTVVEGTQKRKLTRSRGRPTGSKNKIRCASADRNAMDKFTQAFRTEEAQPSATQ